MLLIFMSLCKDFPDIEFNRKLKWKFSIEKIKLSINHLWQNVWNFIHVKGVGGMGYEA